MAQRQRHSKSSNLDLCNFKAYSLNRKAIVQLYSRDRVIDAHPQQNPRTHRSTEY